MRYLSKRDDFLRNSKINEKSDFIRKSKSGLQAYELITEDGGPFYNTVGWNDSLIGRLLNHLIRKAKVALGKLRIKPVLSSLYREFDRIVAQGVLVKADENLKLDFFRLLISEYMTTLKQSIEEEEDHDPSEILGLTNAAIEYLTNEIDEEDIPEKSKLLEELEELKKLLIELGVEKKTTDEEEGEEGKEKEGKEKEEVRWEDKDFITEVYPTMVENLKALSSILKINAKTSSAPAPMNAMANVPVTKEKTPGVKTVESIMLEATETAPVAPDSKDGVSEENVKKAILKLKESIANLTNPKIKIAVDVTLIDSILAQVDKYKDEIIKLYSEICNFLVGKKSKTLNYEPNKLYELYKGSGKNLIGNNVDQIAEKIAKFYKRAFQFETANLFTKIGEIGTPLKSFTDTMKKIKFVISAHSVEIFSPIEAKKEGRLMGYSSFVKVNEEIGYEYSNKDKDLNKPEQGQKADEKPAQGQIPAQGEDIAKKDNAQPGEVPTGSINEKIKDFFDKRCKTVKAYVIDKTEADKIRINFDKLGATVKGNKDGFIIDGLDPIINIIRLFNRAYKIFTVATITQRSGGKVDPLTFGEYTSYGGRSSGSGELNGWAGPFRNNKIFNIWEDGVHKLMADPKYQYIFLPKTQLRIPNVPNPRKQEDYDYRPNIGYKLAEFMEDILNGEELYKISGGSSDSKGAQAAFIKKYFGDPDAKTEGELGKDTSFAIDKDDADSNSTNSSKIGTNAIKLKFKKGVLNKTIKANQFFVVTCKTINEKGEESANTSYRFFQVVEVSGNSNIYLSMCNSFFYFDSYLKDAPNSEKKEGEPVDGRKKTIEKGDLEKLITQSKFQTEDKKFLSYVMKYTSSKSEFINSILISGTKLEITYITSDKNTETEKIKVIAGYWLVDDKSEPYTAYLDKEYLSKKITGGSNSIKDVSTHLRNANNTSIKKI
jgi:hypothetical protein